MSVVSSYCHSDLTKTVEPVWRVYKCPRFTAEPQFLCLKWEKASYGFKINVKQEDTDKFNMENQGKPTQMSWLSKGKTAQVIKNKPQQREKKHTADGGLQHQKSPRSKEDVFSEDLSSYYKHIWQPCPVCPHGQASNLRPPSGWERENLHVTITASIKRIGSQFFSSVLKQHSGAQMRNETAFTCWSPRFMQIKLSKSSKVTV